jgi:hypothetical protein
MQHVLKLECKQVTPPQSGSTRYCLVCVGLPTTHVRYAHVGFSLAYRFLPDILYSGGSLTVGRASPLCVCVCGCGWGGGGGRPPPPSCLYERHIYFQRNMVARQNVYFGRHFG